MLAVVENTVLTGGRSEASGTRPVADGPKSRAKPRRKAHDSPRTAPPPVLTLQQGVRDLTMQQRGPAARRSYGTGSDSVPLAGTTRLSPDKTWAFGTTAIPVPAEQTAPPQVALYAAHWSGGRWQIALSGTAEFGELLTRVPVQLMQVEERRLLARYSAAVGPADQAPPLMLPWRVGGTWTMTATPGRDGQAARPLAAVAFHGGDGVVRAAGPGRLYRFCSTAPGRGLVMVVHPSGLATTYYQMTNVIQIRDGGVVARGEPLGRIGTDRPCGGAPADTPQLQFALRRGTDGVPFDGAQIGGWTFRERARPLVGWAERGLVQVLPGGTLRNLGPVAPPAPAPDKDPAPKPSPGPVPPRQDAPPPKKNQERNASGVPEQ